MAITAIAVTYSHQRVYNLHVDELQCYAVGNSQVLVHNNSAAFTELGEVQQRALISFRSELLDLAKRAAADGRATDAAKLWQRYEIIDDVINGTRRIPMNLIRNICDYIGP